MSTGVRTNDCPFYCLTGFWCGTAAFVFVVTAWWVLGNAPGWYFQGDYASASQWGDSFGAANTLFSGLAFAGVVLTLYFQTRELALQRREIDETQKIMQEATKAQEKTAEAQSKAQQALKQTAELQRKSHVIMGRQADFQLLASYVTGLTALQNASAVSQMELEKRDVHRRLQDVLQQLDGTMQGMLITDGLLSLEQVPKYLHGLAASLDEGMKKLPSPPGKRMMVLLEEAILDLENCNKAAKDVSGWGKQYKHVVSLLTALHIHSEAQWFYDRIQYRETLSEKGGRNCTRDSKIGSTTAIGSLLNFPQPLPLHPALKTFRSSTSTVSPSLLAMTIFPYTPAICLIPSLIVTRMGASWINLLTEEVLQ